MRGSEDEEQCQEDSIAALSSDGESKQTERKARTHYSGPRNLYTLTTRLL